MKLLRLIVFSCFTWHCLPAQTCLTVTGDQILAGDLAKAVPAMASVPPNTPLAPSPVPGGLRVFSFSEIQSLASRFSIDVGPPREACFRLATETLSRDRIEEAMCKALQTPDVAIEILETSSVRVPVGTIEFTREKLGAPAASDQAGGEVWRGDVVYGTNRRFPIWAKVRVTAPVDKIVANEALKPGIVIKSEQVRSERVQGFPISAGGRLTVDQVAGMIPLRSISAGAEIRADNLTRPNVVNRGDLVQVEVRFGSAFLATSGRAETSGHIGDTIAVRNPDSSKLFQARVESAGKVVVLPVGTEIARKEGY